LRPWLDVELPHLHLVVIPLLVGVVTGCRVASLPGYPHNAEKLQKLKGLPAGMHPMLRVFLIMMAALLALDLMVRAVVPLAG
jgi:hypothetical protein